MSDALNINDAIEMQQNGAETVNQGSQRNDMAGEINVDKEVKPFSRVGPPGHPRNNGPGKKDADSEYDNKKGSFVDNRRHGSLLSFYMNLMFPVMHVMPFALIMWLQSGEIEWLALGMAACLYLSPYIIGCLLVACVVSRLSRSHGAFQLHDRLCAFGQIRVALALVALGLLLAGEGSGMLPLLLLSMVLVIGIITDGIAAARYALAWRESVGRIWFWLFVQCNGLIVRRNIERQVAEGGAVAQRFTSGEIATGLAISRIGSCAAVPLMVLLVICAATSDAFVAGTVSAFVSLINLLGGGA